MGAYHADLILVGASLSNCLLAWFIRSRHPDARIVVFEGHKCIPAHRTWCFHRGDVGENFATLAPLIAMEWPGIEIRLPGLHRSFEDSYCAIRPEHLQAEMVSLLGDDLMFATPITEVTTESVRLEDGNVFRAPCVLDGRNDRLWPGRAGYQKFVGLHLTLEEPHELTRATLMNACVPQTDGYRFFYILPWSATRLLVEDTHYSSSPALDLDLYRTEIEAYVQEQGWKIRSVDGRESGVLTVPIDTLGFANSEPAKVGTAGGFFHPVTGYSLPAGVELASRVSRLERLDRESVLGEIARYRAERQGSVRFLCMLNRMMFRAAPPKERFRIFEHFYSLPDATIRRFYAGTLSFQDSARLLCGKPPVKVRAAVRALVTEGPMQ